MKLHILQGGIGNNDQRWLERAALNKKASKLWTTPKSATPGDEAVIFLGTSFFATAKIITEAHPREGWENRYGAKIASIRLIDPPVSLNLIRQAIPELTWANYPRSITTPSDGIADSIRQLIRERRSTKVPILTDEILTIASLEELRAIAVMKSGPARGMLTNRIDFFRSAAIKRYVLRRADGTCEGCQEPAPFLLEDGTPYLEPHHITRLADDGPDHPKNVVALCPNCHRRADLGADRVKFNALLHRAVKKFEMR